MKDWGFIASSEYPLSRNEESPSIRFFLSNYILSKVKINIMQRNKQDKDRSLIQIDVVEKSMRPSRLPSVGRKSEQNRGDS